MDYELKLLLAITRRLPRVRGAGYFANKLINFYRRKPRQKVITRIYDFILELEPNENVDAGLLFYPHLYDWRELEFIQQNLPRGGKFVDAEAYIGWYSLIASKIVGAEGEVIAIEANPYNAERLRRNIELNNIHNIHVFQVGLSDRREKLRLYLNLKGNRGGHTFANFKGLKHTEGPMILCLPLLDILKKCKWDYIDGMKMDIEGFEYRVLKAFLSEAPRTLFPRFLIVEVNPLYSSYGSLKIPELLSNFGYTLFRKYKINEIYILKERL